MDLVTKDLYHSLGVFLIFPLVYHFIQTLPLINYVVINPCGCSYLFHLNKFVLASWLRTKAFLNSCQCRKWPWVNYSFNLWVSVTSAPLKHIYFYFVILCLYLYTHAVNFFPVHALMQPVLWIWRLGAVVIFGLGWLSLPAPLPLCRQWNIF